MNAIILAAGIGSRLSPLTDNTPKSLIKIKGEPIIERQIKYLKEVRIKEIIIVTGFLHEKFDYLIKKYGVKLIYNDKYNIYNNSYSMYLVKEYLKNTYILEGDVYLTRNFLKTDLKNSTYFSGIKEEFNSEWILKFNEDNNINEISIGGGTDYIMSGISYWTMEDSKKIKVKLEELAGENSFKNLFWDNVVKENLKEFKVKTSKIDSTDWFEIDTINDFKKAEEFLVVMGQKDGKSSDSILGVDIRKIQKIELDILLEFDRICKKYNIKYQLFAGTLLGAIRHKTFIPWNDDIDVCMERSEYDKFVSVVDNELPSEYFFQTYERDPVYINKFAKIRRNGTMFMEKLVRDLDMHHGLYIDIFPLDNIELHSIKGKYQLWLLKIIDSLFKYRLSARYETLEPGYERAKAKLKYNIVKTLPIPKIKVENWVLKLMTKFNHKDTEYLADLANPETSVLKKFMMRRETIEDSMLWEFEGHKFPVPKAYDEVLTRAYGDYMQVPDYYNRVSHHNIIKVDLDTKEGNYLRRNI